MKYALFLAVFGVVVSGCQGAHERSSSSPPVVSPLASPTLVSDRAKGDASDEDMGAIGIVDSHADALSVSAPVSSSLNGDVAHQVEQRSPKPQVAGSTPAVPATQPIAFTYEEWLAAKAFPPSEQMRALRVMRCETRGSAAPDYAVGRAGEVGRWQVHPIHAGLVERLGYEWADLTDPEVNGIVARAIWDASGWKAWACA